MTNDILEVAREKVLEQGKGLSKEEVLQVLHLDEQRIPELLDLAHQVRLKWCGEEVEVEGIISCKFCQTRGTHRYCR